MPVAYIQVLATVRLQCHHHSDQPGVSIIHYELHDIAIEMSSSRADPVLGLNILLH